jgi:CDP-4-dehydro-6-deoxyglucose reductase
VDADNPMLDQLVQQGVPVQYACKRGDCGQCAVSLLDGEVQPFEERRPLWQGHELLLCNARAVTDLSIRLPYHPELADIRVLRSPAKVHALEALSDDVMALSLRVPPANEIRYLPGQFIRLTIGNVTRSYSLAAPPTAQKLLTLHIRRVGGGAFSQWLFHQAKPGDLLFVEGPQGHFFLRSGLRVAKTIFLATGTGIAPIWAILQSLTQEDRARLGQVFIYWGNRYIRDAYLGEALAAFAVQEGFSFEALASRESAGSEAHRHVQGRMALHHQRLDDAQVFACGNPQMVQAARAAGERLGLPPDLFFSDPFTAS